MRKRLGTIVSIVGIAFLTITPTVLAGSWVSSGANTYFSGGNVGIGLPPADPLHIHSNAANWDSAWGKMMVGDAQGSIWLGTSVGPGSGSTSLAVNAYNLSDGSHKRKGGYESWLVSTYATNGTAGNYEIWYSPAGGYDGGALNATRALRINSLGVVSVKELVVKADTNTWPDYVFGDGYNLKPLSEVESFLKDNKHLQGIPTAQELDEKGLSVGDMQKKQMQKIEELTLYVIQLKKEIDEMKHNS